MDDLIRRQDAIDAVMKLMPNLTTPDGSGQFDDEIFRMQEMFVDIGQVLNDLPSAQPDQRWIPCSERLPKKHGESYIVTISYGSVYSSALQWDANCKRWYLSFLNDDGNILVDFIDDVIAWMPLPEPYREEG